jgi:hypothetical protein
MYREFKKRQDIHHKDNLPNDIPHSKKKRDNQLNDTQHDNQYRCEKCRLWYCVFILCAERGYDECCHAESRGTC